MRSVVEDIKITVCQFLLISETSGPRSNAKRLSGLEDTKSNYENGKHCKLSLSPLQIYRTLNDTGNLLLTRAE